MNDVVIVESTDRIGQIRLNDPETLNAVSSEMLAELAEAALAFEHDDTIRVVTITGTGRGFCSGARLSPAASDGPTEVDASTLDEVGRAIRAIMSSTKPYVASVNGIAAGVGMSLALACDYVVAAPEAAFMLAFSRIGLMPDGAATGLVAASIGRARAMRMALTAEKISAATALEWGLIAEVCANDALSARTREVCEQLAGSAPLAVALTKQAINAGSMEDVEVVLAREEAGQARLLSTADFAEGVAAFTGRRPAVFTGR